MNTSSNESSESSSSSDNPLYNAMSADPAGVGPGGSNSGGDQWHRNRRLASRSVAL
jgi:hypothetical protein